jgi:hypothetical protein
MAQPLVNFAKRRKIAFTLLAVAVGLLIHAVTLIDIALLNRALYTGVLLYAVMLFLACFNSRKKLSFIPLMKASTWLQIHIYVGFFSLVLFWLHISGTKPQGALEIILAAIFLIVCASGVFGLIISRTLPAQMNNSGEPITWEKIPTLRRHVVDEVQECVLDAERKSGSSTLSDYYLNKLRAYFDYRPGCFHVFCPNSKYRVLRVKFDEQKRYLNDSELEYHNQILDCMERKRHLDFMQSANGLLRTWLFIHIPFTFSLLIIGLIHGIIALMYGGAK